jgi:hypothetical protein
VDGRALMLASAASLLLFGGYILVIDHPWWVGVESRGLGLDLLASSYFLVPVAVGALLAAICRRSLTATSVAAGCGFAAVIAACSLYDRSQTQAWPPADAWPFIREFIVLSLLMVASARGWRRLIRPAA